MNVQSSLALIAAMLACSPQAAEAPAPAATRAPTQTPQAQPATPPARPNILLVSFDTTRADALGCYGARSGATPTLDRLAAEGVLFETAFSPIPLTLPAHTTMLTGLDPCRHSVRDNGIYDVPLAAETLAEILGANGWRTFGVIGSIVLLSRHQMNQGFGAWDEEGLVISKGDEHERQADRVADAVLKQLAGSQPFFGFVHFYDPHQPYRAPKELEAKVGNAYFAEIALADRALGRILDALRSDGRLDHTLVVFTSDHGEGLGEHGEQSHGMLLHDATQHVPLIVRHPAFKPARVADVLAKLADLTPTILDFVDLAAASSLDGRSLLPALRGEEMEHGDVYLETRSPQIGYDFAPLYGVRTADWKFVLGSRPHLWHISEDPKELKDVAADHAEDVAELTRRVLHLRDRRGPALTVDPRRVSGAELAVFGGLGYVSAGSADADADASRLPDPYDHIAATDEITRASSIAETGQLDAAIAAFVPLAERYPGCFHVRESLGALYGRKGDHARALAELEAAAAIHASSADLQIQIALAAFFCQKPDLVKSHLERAIAIEGCPPRAYFMLWETLTKGGDVAGGRAVLEKLLARSDVPPAERQSAEQLLQRKDP